MDFGAALGWQWIIISPPRAAGISRLTGFNRKSGAKAKENKQTGKLLQVLSNRNYTGMFTGDLNSTKVTVTFFHYSS